MRHDVHDTAGRLVRRQGERQLGVHYGEVRAVQIAAVAALEPVAGQNGAVAGLAARGRDRQHHSQRDAPGGHGALHGNVPRLKVRVHAIGRHLGGVYHAAAADGQEHVAAVFPGKPGRVGRELSRGIRLDAAQLGEVEPRAAQAALHPLQQSAAHRAAAAVADERLLHTQLAHGRARVVRTAAAEVYLCRGMQVKVEHVSPPAYQRTLSSRPARRAQWPLRRVTAGMSSPPTTLPSVFTRMNTNGSVIPSPAPNQAPAAVK